MSIVVQAKIVVLGPGINALSPSIGIFTLLQEQMCLSMGSAVLDRRRLTSIGASSVSALCRLKLSLCMQAMLG